MTAAKKKGGRQATLNKPRAVRKDAEKPPPGKPDARGRKAAPIFPSELFLLIPHSRDRQGG
jgi:hypothetical protein